jgi:fumarylacetoacetase
MYWTPGQQLAHMTVNGAALRTGDLFASGTVSGARVDERGSFLELSWGGREPLSVDGLGDVAFLEDGDVVTIRGSATGTDGERITLDEVRGRITPARE